MVDQVRMQYLRIYTDYMRNEETTCPYCGHGVGYADLHDDDCFMLDIIAYIENDVPLPAQAAPAAEPPADVQAVAVLSTDKLLRMGLESADKVIALQVENSYLRDALELIVKLGDDYRDGEGSVGVNFTLATMLKAAREGLQSR